MINVSISYLIGVTIIAGFFGIIWKKDTFLNLSIKVLMYALCGVSTFYLWNFYGK